MAEAGDWEPHVQVLLSWKLLPGHTFPNLLQMRSLLHAVVHDGLPRLCDPRGLSQRLLIFDQSHFQVDHLYSSIMLQHAVILYL